MALEFSRVAAAALAQAETLCQSWLGGKRSGHEWLGERRANGGLGDSWSVNLNSGAWGHFGSDEKGGDLISLYAALNHTTQLAALEVVAKLVGVTNGAAGHPVLRVVREERPAEPIPTDAPPVPDHRVHGIASALYRYGDAFVVARYELPAGKQFCPWTWRAGKWTPKAYPAPRPLYGLVELALRPEDPVLVVEGEKCHEAAARLLGVYIAITWAGGAQAVKTADWGALADRDVLLWPDADDAGRAAMAGLAAILLPICKRVRMLDTAGQPDGWDIADCPLGADELAEWARPRVKTLQLQAKTGRPHSGPAPLESSPVSWQSFNLDCNAGGVPHPTIANAAAILAGHPQTSGTLWFDEFRNKIMLTRADSTRPWKDSDDLETVAFIQQQLRLPKMGLQTIVHAVQLVAQRHRRNSVTTWLDSLTWDGTERLSAWTTDYLGCPNTAYTQAAGRNWLISMVARAFKPGCQADHMPVLEGASGRGKSSALAILGGEWYRAAPQAFGSKEFLEVMQGSWLIEIPDMVGFGRREHTQIIAAITTRADPFRASYGRHAEDYQRTVIFVATSETDEYLQDSRGIRRYWPLRCGDIDLTLLAVMREQLFAEAVSAYRGGATWHEMPEDETRKEQFEREHVDVWIELIEPWLRSRASVTAGEVMTGCIEIEASRQTRADQMRVAQCLKHLGYRCKVERVGGVIHRVYRR